MTNDQNAMPERIWRSENFFQGKTATSEQPITGGTEYIRADIHEAVVKELKRANDGWHVAQASWDGCNKHRAELETTIIALQRQLAQCRREALEEAAKMCDNMEPWIQADGTSDDAPAWRCAEAIRKLIEKEGVG